MEGGGGGCTVIWHPDNWRGIHIEIGGVEQLNVLLRHPSNGCGGKG